MYKSPARVKLDKYRDMVLHIFDYRCVVCGNPSNEIHEIVPISWGKSSLLIKNRVVICRQHHTWAHESTRKSIPILIEKRREFLRRKWSLRCRS